MLLHALELLKCLLELLFTLIVGKQSALLALEYSLEELTFACEHLADLDSFLTPVLDIRRELLHFSFEV